MRVGASQVELTVLRVCWIFLRAFAISWTGEKLEAWERKELILKRSEGLTWKTRGIESCIVLWRTDVWGDYKRSRNVIERMGWECTNLRKKYCSWEFAKANKKQRNENSKEKIVWYSRYFTIMIQNKAYS